MNQSMFIAFGFLVGRYSILSWQIGKNILYSDSNGSYELSDDSLGDTPVPMPNTAVKP